MLNKLLVGAVALTVLGGVAFAENNTTAQPPAQDQNTQNQMSQGNGDQNQDDQNQGWWGGHWRHHGHGHGHGGMRGMMGEQGPGPGMGGGAMMGKSGFRMTLGNGVNVGVMCGNEAMKDCIAEAQPLIDAAKGAAAAQPAAKSP